MTADEFRELALQLPGAVEDAHMGHPDFRVNGRIFATLGPREDWGMVKLSTDLQQSCWRDDSAAFQPINGAWGARGATRVILSAASAAIVKPVLAAAWRIVAEANAGRRKR